MTGPIDLAAIIRSALTDAEGDDNQPLCLNVDYIDGEPGTLGVETSSGERFFVTVEPV